MAAQYAIQQQHVFHRGYMGCLQASYTLVLIEECLKSMLG